MDEYIAASLLIVLMIAVIYDLGSAVYAVIRNRKE